jgi:hypothetical protein
MQRKVGSILSAAKGENYDPTFLRLNPKATVPTLIVPLSNTLSEEVDSRYKAITESTVRLFLLPYAWVLTGDTGYQ